MCSINKNGQSVTKKAHVSVTSSDRCTGVRNYGRISVTVHIVVGRLYTVFPPIKPVLKYKPGV